MKLNSKSAGIIVLLIWGVITLLRALLHQPWFDEAHAYLLAQNYSFIDLMSEMREEGHLMIWYLLIMPFAKLKLCYPYPMQMINWLCALGALILFWKKAPFNPITKTIITFSFPFLGEVSVVSRCYAVGILLLFSIAALYKKSLQHPIIYSALIILAANTSVMALFGASAFGFVFAYDLIRGALKDKVSRKDFTISFSIMALGAALVLWQLGSSINHPVPMNGTFIINFSSFIYGNGLSRLFVTKLYITVAVYLMLIFTPIILLIKSRKLFFIASYIFVGMMTCFLFKYAGYSQHYIFFWFYTLILFWLMIEQEAVKSRLMILAEVILIIFWGVQLISTETNNVDVYHSYNRTMASIIKNNIEPNSRIIITTTLQDAIIPYLENDDIEVYTYYKAAPAAANCKNFFESVLYSGTGKLLIYAAWLEKSLSDSRVNYIILPAAKQKAVFVVRDKYLSVTLDPVALLKNDFALYKVVEVTYLHEKR